jgi:two-component system cell cycle response regulator
VAVSLRTRLWLVVCTVVVVPLLVGAVLIGFLASNVAATGTQQRLATAAAAVQQALADRCAVLGTTARAVGAQTVVSGPAPAVEAAADSADYIGIITRPGEVLAENGTLPDPNRTPGELPGCGSEQSIGRVIAGVVPIDVTEATGIVTVVAADALDEDFLEAQLRRLLGGEGADLSVLDRNGAQVATTAPAESAADMAAAALASGGTFEVNGRQGAVRRSLGTLPWTVVATEAAPGVFALDRVLPALVVLLLVSLALALLIARLLTRPLAELSAAAERVTESHPEVAAGVPAGDEVGRLSVAFHRITGQLHRSESDLRRTNQEVQEGLAQMGEALQSTLDMNKLLDTVLRAGLTSTGSVAGMALTHDGTGRYLPVAQRGMDDVGLPVPEQVIAGQGVLGEVARRADGLRGRFGEFVDLPEPTPGEPASGDVLVMPLRRGSRVGGLLALYGRRDGEPYTPDDEERLRTLADQAGIAVDNIRLHKEAERLMMTDPLTGLRNFRYLSSELAREIERATRFDRPLAVLMLDLDHFKSVNDTYGHARGDSVLRELARRVSEQIREVDTLARYGGEEFVIVLPETTAQGACMLADRVCAAVRRQVFTAQGEEPLRVTLSIGVAAFPVHGASAATLMRAADEALYVAKRAGRDRWHLAEAPEEGDA